MRKNNYLKKEGSSDSKGSFGRKGSISYGAANRNSMDDDYEIEDDDEEYPFDDGWKCFIF